MLRSRISRRVIAEHHLQLSSPKRPGYIGIIGIDLSVWEAVEFAVQKTRHVGAGFQMAGVVGWKVQLA